MNSGLYIFRNLLFTGGIIFYLYQSLTFYGYIKSYSRDLFLYYCLLCFLNNKFYWFSFSYPLYYIFVWRRIYIYIYIYIFKYSQLNTFVHKHQTRTVQKNMLRTVNALFPYIVQVWSYCLVCIIQLWNLS